MAAQVAYFGIRHHGPGSTNALLQALESLDPSCILIEGPADASELISVLAHSALEPPVALLIYASKQPEAALFFPVACFSPEFQAARWALSRGKTVRFIDLPATHTLAVRIEQEEAARQAYEAELARATAAESALERELEEATPDSARDGANGVDASGLDTSDSDSSDSDSSDSDSSDSDSSDSDSSDAFLRIRRDPIGALGLLAGYEDGESWWNDLVEANPEPGPVFAGIESAMVELRQTWPRHRSEDETDREDQREAHMRLEIDKAAKKESGPVAVVCGAWHVPALRERRTAKADKELLAGLPKVKTQATWVPWTYPRLAFSSGYGAGVAAPLWYDHLWNHGHGAHAQALWLAKVAKVLRDKGHLVSTASLIEATRLATSLAALRERPAPGFEELRDAIVACFSFGESRPWRDHEAALLLGDQVGTIPPDLPLAPLLDDLARRQKQVGLKPEALAKELSIDLRSESGLARSTLLHQLTILDVPWGQLADVGRSRGTFRERWVLAWEPEYSVRLIERLVHGQTIVQAATTLLVEQLAQSTSLKLLADKVQDALVAQLPEAAEAGTKRLQSLATQSSDAAELLGAISPLANIVRYGTAREMAIEHFSALLTRLTIQAATALPYAVRNLAEDEAEQLSELVGQAHEAIALAELSSEDREPWIAALHQIVDEEQSSPRLAGVASRLLYQDELIDTERVKTLLSRLVSPGISIANAAQFFEGFFTGIGARLIHDSALRDAVDGWLINLSEEEFIEHLPLVRRVFSGLDANERRGLLAQVRGGEANQTERRIVPELMPVWEQHRQRIIDLLMARTPLTPDGASDD